MSYLRNSQLANAQLWRDLNTSQYVRTPSFAEVERTAYAETTAMELVHSENRIRAKYLDPQKAELTAMRDSGQITDEEWKTFRIWEFGSQGSKIPRQDMDWKALAEFANETKGTSFDFTEEGIYAQSIAESEERQQLLNQAEGLSGFAAQFIGTSRAMLNPRTAQVELASFLIPGTQLRFGSSALSTAAKMAFREGLLNVGIEAAYQAKIYEFKNRIGMQYNLSDASANLLAAFTFGGLVGATRGVYNISVGNTSVRDAIAANQVVIDELSARTDLDAAERVILRDLQQAQKVFENIEVKSSGARQAYTQSLTEVASQHAPSGAVARAVAAGIADLAEETPSPSGILPPTPVDDPVLRRQSYNAVNAAIRQYGAVERIDSPIPVPTKEFRARLTAEMNQRLPETDRQQLQENLEFLLYEIERTPEASEEMLERVNEIDARLDADARARDAEADLGRLEEGIVPERFLNEIGPTRSTFSELAAQDDMDQLQMFFELVGRRDDAELAGRVYNEMVRRDMIDLHDAQDMPPRVPDEAVQEVSADIQESSSLSPKYDEPDVDIPEEELDQMVAELVEVGDDVTIEARPLREVVEEIDSELAESQTKLDNVVSCVRGG